jgi:hypothetical protein
MGLTIHYSGQFRKRASLAGFVSEVKKIAETWGWAYHVFETEFPPESGDGIDEKLYGLLVTPPESEPLSFTFLSDRRLADVGSLSVWDKTEDPEGKSLYGSFTKTQFAGPDVHMEIIGLIRYLAPKYFTRFKVYDESDYWETGDEKVMREKFAFLDGALSKMRGQLESQERLSDETLEDYIGRVAKDVKKELDEEDEPMGQ